MSGVQTDCKVYVNVRAAFLPDGKMLPEELTWEDGTPYTIEPHFECETLCRKESWRSGRLLYNFGKRKAKPSLFLNAVQI